MENLKSKKMSAGITLIALVVTIIVLLILAGISIQMLTGDNGILQRAGETTEKTEREKIIEQARIDVLGQIAENKGENISESEFKEILKKYFKEESIPNDFPEDLSIVELITLDAKYKICASEIYNGLFKSLFPGLYYAGTNNLIMSWKELIKPENQMINVNDNVLSRNAFDIKGKFESDTMVKLIVDSSITKVSNMGGISNLAEVKLPDTITDIAASSFSGCNDLESVAIPSGNIGAGAFSGISKLKTVKLGDKVTSIGSGAFNGCSTLKSIEIPDYVTSLGEYSFYGCSSLENIKIGNGGVDIRQNVFGNDNTIRTIEIKSGTLGAGAFNSKSDLETIKLGKDVDISETSIFGACTDLTNVYLEEGITTIGEWCFGGCNKLTNISIPNSVTSIGDRAFQNCPLKTIFINSSNIGEEAFEYTSLTDITIGPNVRNIGKKAFNSLEADNKVVDINIQEGLNKIGECAFANYSKYPALNISLPNTLLYIEKEAFLNCRMMEIKIPKSVTSIESDAFKNCIELQNIIIENGSTLTIPNNKWGATNATITPQS